MHCYNHIQIYSSSMEYHGFIVIWRLFDPWPMVSDIYQRAVTYKQIVLQRNFMLKQLYFGHNALPILNIHLVADISRDYKDQTLTFATEELVPTAKRCPCVFLSDFSDITWCFLLTSYGVIDCYMQSQVSSVRRVVILGLFYLLMLCKNPKFLPEHLKPPIDKASRSKHLHDIIYTYTPYRS